MDYLDFLALLRREAELSNEIRATLCKLDEMSFELDHIQIGIASAKGERIIDIDENCDFELWKH